MDGGLKSVKSKCFTNSLPSSAHSTSFPSSFHLSFVVLVPCFLIYSLSWVYRSCSSCTVQKRRQMRVPLVRNGKKERWANARERERARERECRSVCPCGFRMNSVCVRERETVSEPVREKQTERMRERFADWLAGSAVRGARDWRECDPCQVSGVRDLHQLD